MSYLIFDDKDIRGRPSPRMQQNASVQLHGFTTSRLPAPSSWTVSAHGAWRLTMLSGSGLWR